MKRKMYLSVVVREHNGLWHETRRILVPSPMSAIEGMEISREVIVGIISAFSEDHEKNAGGEKKKMWIEGEDLDCIIDMYDVTEIEGQETDRMGRLIERIKKWKEENV